MTMLVFLIAVLAAIGTDEGDTKLVVTGPANTTVRQGESATITVKVHREGFDADVELRFTGLLAGVRFKGDPTKGLKVPKGTTEATFTLEADLGAKPTKDHKAQLTANAGNLETPPIEFRLVVVGKE